MKFKIDIECTPEEARTFFGLPDIAPVQEALMQQVQDRMEENIRNMDAETLANTWLPATMQSWGEMQKMFWSQMQNMGTGATGGKDSQPGDKDD